MFDFFKTMKDSFQGNKKKTRFKTGIYQSKAEQELLSNDAEMTKGYIHNSKVFFMQMILHVIIGIGFTIFPLFSDRRIPTGYYSQTSGIFIFNGFISLVICIFFAHKALNLTNSRLKKIEEQLKRQDSNQQETISAA